MVAVVVRTGRRPVVGAAVVGGGEFSVFSFWIVIFVMGWLGWRATVHNQYSYSGFIQGWRNGPKLNGVGIVRCRGTVVRRREFRLSDLSSSSLLLHPPSSASPSLREGRKRGFASFRGGALRERVEGRELRGEEEKRREE
jgi:hypothetical protein